MRARTLLAFLVVLSLAACAGTATKSFPWREPLTTAAPLPERVALFVDASFVLRAPDYRQYIAIAESVRLADKVNDTAELAITGAKMSLVLQKKYFINSYGASVRAVAEREDAELYNRAAPIHLDPTVCRTEKTTQAVTELWQAAAKVFDGELSLPKELTYSLGARYQADTLALVFVISRKEDKSSTAPPTAAAAALETQAASMVGVVLVRAVDGKVVYHAAVPIAGPQRIGTVKSAVYKAFSGLPERAAHSSYPVPRRISAIPELESVGDSGSPWIKAPTQKQRPKQTGFAAPKGEPNSGRPGMLKGRDKIYLLRRPMAVADPITEAPNGTTVRVLQRDMNWFLVLLPDGAMGWVYHTQVEVY